MKKIVFGITSLGLGGAERVLVDMCNKLADKYDITIFTLYGSGEFESQLKKEIKLVSVYERQYNSLSKITKTKISLQMVNSFLRKKIYDKYIKDKFDVEVAFLEGPMTWIFSEQSKAKKIAWVHNDIESVFGKGSKAAKKQKMNEECYKKYDELVFVSNDNLNKFSSFFMDNKVNKRVIYNYLDCELVIDKANSCKAKEIDEDVISFVQVSRLVEQKAVLRLIDVHKKLVDEGYKYKIYIVGDGNLKDDIQKKVKELNVSDSFILLGKKQNPYPYIKNANYFMLTSYYEGYPMVLLEAKALNKFIMITDSAARETLEGYSNKLIVENSVDGIYKGIKNILDGKIKIEKNKDNGNKKIIDQIIKLIEGE